jgi:hypothetical protein
LDRKEARELQLAWFGFIAQRDVDVVAKVEV